MEISSTLCLGTQILALTINVELSLPSTLILWIENVSEDIVFSIFPDDQEKLIPYLMEKFQEYQPLILEFLSNMRKNNQSYF